MNPVAYMSKNGILFKELPPEPMDLEPLYPAKTLTDEEIEVLWEKHCPFDLTAGIDFANAVLKKAQQK